MRTTWRTTLTVTAACCALGLAGCGEKPAPEPAPTAASTSTAATSSPTPSSEETTQAPDTAQDPHTRDLDPILQGLKVGDNSVELLPKEQLTQIMELAKNAGDGLDFTIEPESCEQLLDISAKTLADAKVEDVNIAMAMNEQGESLVVRDADEQMQQSFANFDQQMTECANMKINYGTFVSGLTMEKIDVSDIDAEQVLGVRSLVEISDVKQETITLQALKGGLLVAVTGTQPADLEAYKDVLREMLSRV